LGGSVTELSVTDSGPSFEHCAAMQSSLLLNIAHS
jgi:hypothetical protein